MSPLRRSVPATLRLAAMFTLSVLAGGLTEGRPELRYELTGKIVQNNGKPFRDVIPMVFLHSATTPFAIQTPADARGHFKFKRLLDGIYTLIVAVPHAGELRKSLDVGPSFADSKRRISTVLLFERRPKSNPNHGISAVELSIPPNAWGEYKTAQKLLEKRNTTGAVEHFERAVEIAPQFAAAWNNLGTIAYKGQEYEKAEKNFREALKQDPASYPALVNLGGTLLSMHRFDEALHLNRLAADQRPDDALAHAQLGQNYFYLDQLQDAETHLKIAEALDPSHFSYPQLVLSKVYQRLNNFSLAAQELLRFLELHPDSKLVPYAQRELAMVRSHSQE